MESKISHDLDIYILTGRKQKVEVKVDNQKQQGNVNIRDDARHFAGGPRGQYILAQALFYGIQSLESVQPEIRQETSNISDMKFLQHAFDFPPELFDTNGFPQRLATIADSPDTSIPEKTRDWAKRMVRKWRAEYAQDTKEIS